MENIATITLQKERMKFSCAHFTVFSATERENIHGHNYSVRINLTYKFCKHGLNFSYNDYKKKFITLCEKLDDTLLLAKNSEFLKFSEDDKYHIVEFHDEKMFFLKRDVTLLDIANISVEELTHWFLKQLLIEEAKLRAHQIFKIDVHVYSAVGQGGIATWEAD